ncbi:MAG: hypothetical protein OEQ13_02350 [Acidobacteriota bacterium]|nr:hypothetical protein [Acidobacteriota bacterium]
MLVKTFRAPSASEALNLVREALGPNAAVLETRRASGRVEVLAMAERPGAGAPRPAAAVPRSQLVTAAAALCDALTVQGFSSAVAQRIGSAAQANLDERALSEPRTALAYARTLLALLLPPPSFGCLTGASVLALVGAPGVGKTTTVAKLAARECRSRRRRVVIASADDRRLGGAEQARSFARILELPFRLVHAPGDLDAARAEVGDGGLVLLDTPGVSQGDEALVEKLGWQLAGVGRDEIELLLAADTEPDALAQIVGRFRLLSPGALGATRVDEAVRRGGLASAVLGAGLPLVHLSSGPDVPEDLELVDADRFAEWALPPQTKQALAASFAEALR